MSDRDAKEDRNNFGAMLEGLLAVGLSVKVTKHANTKRLRNYKSTPQQEPANPHSRRTRRVLLHCDPWRPFAGVYRNAAGEARVVVAGQLKSEHLHTIELVINLIT